MLLGTIRVHIILEKAVEVITKRSSVQKYKVISLIIVAIVVSGLLWWYGPIAQPLAYHDFAGHLAFLGIPNFKNVISNIIFFIVSLYALYKLLLTKNLICFIDQREIIFYVIFFFSIFLTSLGSAYYHSSPNNMTLILDRLPMTIAFMSFFAAIIAEYISCRWGLFLLPIFLFFGLLSIIYWYLSMKTGSDDLRLYLFILIYPILAIIMILMMYRAPYTQVKWIWFALVFYLIAKGFEGLDQETFIWTHHVVSGHTMKHLLSGFSVCCLWLYLRLRSIKGSANKAGSEASQKIQTKR